MPDGLGTALKPAFEPVVVARKQLVGTVAGNVQAHGTGALNIDAARIGTSGGGGNGLGSHFDKLGTNNVGSVGRWPANVVLDADQAATLNQQSGVSYSPPVGSVAVKKALTDQVAKGDEAARVSPNGHGDSGGASRFFYVAKAPTAERPKQGGIAHPTVKPIDLMQWLVRLVTPPGGVVLDPFAGSGTTGEATIREGFASILIEREADYLPLIRERFQRPINYILDFGDPA